MHPSFKAIAIVGKTSTVALFAIMCLGFMVTLRPDAFSYTFILGFGLLFVLHNVVWALFLKRLSGVKHLSALKLVHALSYLLHVLPSVLLHSLAIMGEETILLIRAMYFIMAILCIFVDLLGLFLTYTKLNNRHLSHYYVLPRAIYYALLIFTLFMIKQPMPWQFFAIGVLGTDLYFFFTYKQALVDYKAPATTIDLVE